MCYIADASCCPRTSNHTERYQPDCPTRYSLTLQSWRLPRRCLSAQLCLVPSTTRFPLLTHSNPVHSQQVTHCCGFQHYIRVMHGSVFAYECVRKISDRHTVNLDATAAILGATMVSRLACCRPIVRTKLAMMELVWMLVFGIPVEATCSAHVKATPCRSGPHARPRAGDLRPETVSVFLLVNRGTTIMSHRLL